MTNKAFDFRGTGFGYLWLLVWTTFISIITIGLFFPWGYSAQQRWKASNTYINGQQLVFNGTGVGFLGHWVSIVILSMITFGIYIPWAACQIERWKVENMDFAANYSKAVNQ
jgi:uncharacterized membrane protein YjgN (DUF898 family)